MHDDIKLSCDHLILTLRYRQKDAKGRASGLTFEVNLPLMFVNNFSANIEAEAAPFACRFRGEKRLEDAPLNFWRNAGAGAECRGRSNFDP